MSRAIERMLWVCVGYLLFVQCCGDDVERIKRVGNDLQGTVAGVDQAGTIVLVNDIIFTPGVVFAFSAFFRTDKIVYFQIWRPENGNNTESYTLISQTKVQPSVVNSKETIYIAGKMQGPCPYVQDGDRLGMYFVESPGSVAYSFDEFDPRVMSYTLDSQNSSVEVGHMIRFDKLIFPYDFSVCAYIDTNTSHYNLSAGDDEFTCPDLLVPKYLVSLPTTVSTIAITGRPGDTGATGPEGNVGATGPAGRPGPQGIPGSSGLPGLEGGTGPHGMRGVPGFNGATGATGIQGKNGATGPHGEKGGVGGKGATGSHGPAGPQGAMALIEEDFFNSRLWNLILLAWLCLITLILLIILVVMVSLHVGKKRRRTTPPVMTQMPPARTSKHHDHLNEIHPALATEHWIGALKEGSETSYSNATATTHSSRESRRPSPSANSEEALIMSTTSLNKSSYY